MLIRSEMLRRVRSIVALVLLVAVAIVPFRAEAQTTSAENVLASGNTIPARYIGGVLQGTRPVNLNPTGINYSDCISDMTLQFTVALSGFAAADLASMQIWASKTGSCNSSAARGVAAIPVCWPLGQGTPAGFIAVSTVTETFNVRVQDIVGPQNSPSSNYVRQGADACSTQSTYAAVPITLWFLPIDSSGNDLGTAYSYPISVDLVGPPPPQNPSETVGDTLFNINWTPNVDADTAGYDIYIDPSPGGGTASSRVDAAQTELICPDASQESTSTTTGDGSLVDDSSGSDGASTEEGGLAAANIADATVAEASVARATSSGCYNQSVSTTSSTNTNTSCTSAVLGSSIVIDAGGVATVVDEAGTVVDLAGGGISTIPAGNLIGVNAGFTVSSESSGSYTITGLTNNVTYNVVVAAVDGSGNIGPPSSEQCDFPAPVNDFWKTYRDAGGQAGGGFCALEAVGLPVGSTVAFAGLGASILALGRRRRRRQ